MKPILFNTEMVKAILDGRKTETRRPLKIDLGLADTDSNDKAYLKIPDEYGDYHDGVEYAKYRVGDILYVREAWRFHDMYDMSNIDKVAHVFYKAQNTGQANRVKFTEERYNKFLKFSYKNGWQPSLFMPKEVARIFLKVTGVRVERLNEITAGQVEKEGIKHRFKVRDKFSGPILIQRFMDLWDSIYKDYPSSSNPWVFVYEFETCNKDGDE